MYKVNEGRPNVADHLVNRSIDLVINTPLGRDSFFDDRAVRRAATMAQVPCITTLTGASAAVSAIRALRQQALTVRSLQDYYAGGRGRLNRAGEAEAERTRRIRKVDVADQSTRVDPVRRRSWRVGCPAPSVSSPRFAPRVDLVQVWVVGGRRRTAGSITGLARDDFEVFEDGVAQPITQFSDERVPVSLGVLLDASDSMRGEPMVDARRAVDRFRGRTAAPGDEAFVATFNHAPRLLPRWTQPPASLRQRACRGAAVGRHGHLRRAGAFAPHVRTSCPARARRSWSSPTAPTPPATTRCIRLAMRCGEPMRSSTRLPIDAPDARDSTRVNPECAARDHRAERRLHRSRAQRRGSRPRHRADCRRAEPPVHARLRAPAWQRRELAQHSRSACATTDPPCARGAGTSSRLAARKDLFLIGPEASRRPLASIRSCPQKFA